MVPTSICDALVGTEPEKVRLKMVIHTIGHSNRTAEDMTAQLRNHSIARLVDIRAFPRSRRHPQFDRAALSTSLAQARIGYHWSGRELGGFRKPRGDSENTALRDAAFRGFADYMGSERFQSAMARLLESAASCQLAMMCAEGHHHHCHRQFIADYLELAGHAVFHINGDGSLSRHQFHGCLNEAGGQPVYNKHEQGDLFADDDDDDLVVRK